MITTLLPFFGPVYDGSSACQDMEPDALKALLSGDSPPDCPPAKRAKIDHNSKAMMIYIDP